MAVCRRSSPTTAKGVWVKAMSRFLLLKVGAEGGLDEAGFPWIPEEVDKKAPRMEGKKT